MNSVCTFYELTEGDDSVGQPFHRLDRDILIKSLKILEKKSKAEIFESQDGIKFFWSSSKYAPEDNEFKNQPHH